MLMAKSWREPPDQSHPNSFDDPADLLLDIGWDLTSSDPFTAKVCAIASRSFTAEPL
jgi:hypothetical protein